MKARQILERKLGRKLKSDEETHHKDHNPKNNEENNLEPLIIKEHNILHFKGKDAFYKRRRG